MSFFATKLYLPVIKSPELTQYKLSFANPCADNDILRCICPGKKSSLGTQDFLSGGHPVQNMTQYFFQIFLGFLTVPLPRGELDAERQLLGEGITVRGPSPPSARQEPSLSPSETY